MPQTRYLRRSMILAIFGLVYFAAGKLGLRLAFVNASASAVWPPTGIALAGLLVLGFRVWPVVFLGAFLVNITTAGTMMTSLGIALGNTLEGLAGAWLVSRFAGARHAFDHSADVIKFAGLAAMCAPAISATIGVTVLALGGFAAWNDFGSIWRTWWFGDASGALVVTPLLMTWAANPRIEWDRRRKRMVAGALLGLLLAGAAIFGEWLPFRQKGYPLLFLLLPLLVWIAFRFAQRETATAMFILSAVAVAGTLRGLGPFSRETQNESLIFLQVFIGMIVTMNMTLTAAVSERRASEQRLAAQQDTTRILAESQTLSQAMPRILAAICEKLHWEVGCFWQVSADEKYIECVQTWSQGDATFGEFIEVSKRDKFPPGIGMPGRAWKQQSVIWIDDVVADPNFPRAPFAAKAGLHSAFASPLIIAGRVFGVMEFFTPEFRASKDALLAMIAAAGSQIGQFAERKQTENMLAQHASIVESSDDAIYSKTLEGIITSWNKAAHSLYGYAASEILGQNALLLVPPERITEERELLGRVGRGNHIASYETVRRRKDGTLVDISLTVSPIKTGDRIHGVSVIARDATERKRAAAEIERQKASAEAANRAKDEFLAALSHELRTPLTPVLLLAAAMEQSGEVPAQIRKDFAMIRKNIELEARIIDDLLDLTRISHGKLTLNFGRADPQALIEHTLEILRNEIQAKRIGVTLEFAAVEHHVRADAVRLEQVFWNLLKNAVKFTPPGGRITIRSWNTGGLLNLAIADTGLGITAEELPRIFETFAQGDEAAAPRFGGLGLGLSISAVLVREHGGRIWGESPGRDQGATFHVELPLAVSSASVEVSQTALHPPAMEPARILLVEDHESTRETLARLLARRGHTVKCADGVAKALEIARCEKIDIVISDLGLPDGHGHDLMRELHREFDLPGIALSGYGMESDIATSKEAGFDEHITKPIDLPKLESAIQQIVGARKAAHRNL